MSLYSTINNLIIENRYEIVNNDDWFYALDEYDYELNVHDYDDDGVYTVCISPRRGGITNWSRIIYIPSLYFTSRR